MNKDKKKINKIFQYNNKIKIKINFGSRSFQKIKNNNRKNKMNESKKNKIEENSKKLIN
jgi:hypothetical protein